MAFRLESDQMANPMTTMARRTLIPASLPSLSNQMPMGIHNRAAIVNVPVSRKLI